MDFHTGPFSGTADEWDTFVRGRSGWTHFHLWGWKRIVEEVFGHDCLYLCARTEPDGSLAAVLPLVRVKSVLFGDYLVSMPFLNYGGPLGTEGGVRAVTERAVERAEREGVDLLELRSRQARSFLDLSASKRKITVLKDLPPGDSETLWSDLDSKVRNQVRKPRKEGVETQFGPEHLDSFFEVYSRHMRNLGTPTQPKALFDQIRQEFPDDVWFGCAYYEEEPVACGCGLEWGDEFEMTWASDLFEYRTLAPNMLLYWRFMERAAEEGLEVFNFGRCTPGSGTHRFKKQWGVRDQQLWWYQHGADGAQGTPSPEDSQYQLGIRLWKMVPLSVARALGPRIVKYIP